MVLLSEKTSTPCKNEGLEAHHFQNEYPNNNYREDEQAKQTDCNTNKQGPYSKEDNKPDVLFKLMIGVSKKIGQLINRANNFILTDLEANQLLDRFIQWCVHHPQMAIGVLVALLVSSLPILLFLAFALSTIVMTITGFLVLEGTLLTIISMIIIGLLAALLVTILFFALVGFATYFGVSHVYDMYNSTERERTNLRNALKRNIETKKRCV